MGYTDSPRTNEYLPTALGAWWIPFQVLGEKYAFATKPFLTDLKVVKVFFGLIIKVYKVSENILRQDRRRSAQMEIVLCKSAGRSELSRLHCRCIALLSTLLVGV